MKTMRKNTRTCATSLHLPRPLCTLLMWSTLICLAGASVQDDPVKDLGSKKVERRLKGLVAMEASAESVAVEDGELRAEWTKILTKGLKDNDWEVAERCAGLLGIVGNEKSVKPLVSFALSAPTSRARKVAAGSLANLDASKATEGLAKKLGGKTAEAALEGLLQVVALDEEGEAQRALVKLLRDKDPAMRAGAAQVLFRYTKAERIEHLAVLEDESLWVQCSALEGLIAAPALEQPDGTAMISAVSRLLARPGLEDVLERRARAALASAAVAADAGETEGQSAVIVELTSMMNSWDKLGGRSGGGSKKKRSQDKSTGAAVGHERWMRLAYDMLAQGCKPTEHLGAAAAGMLRSGLQSKSSAARAAAAKALCTLVADHPNGGHDGLFSEVKTSLFEQAQADPESHARASALVGLALAVEEAGEDELIELAVQLLQDDNQRVREQAAVVLGNHSLLKDEPVQGSHGVALGEALQDSEWQVVVVAAVSLGKTRARSGLKPLLDLAASDDWRLRGAGLIGLKHLHTPEAMPRMIEALEDPKPTLAEVARRYLHWVRGKELGDWADEDWESRPERSADWLTWWQDEGEKHTWPDPDAARKRREKYRYAVSEREVFEQLDVVVLDSRGDHIQEVFNQLGIPFRSTQANHLHRSRLHSGAIYISNCTGEIEPQDVEELQWFVLSGGFLAGSCWSLSHTVERVYPGVVRMLRKAGSGTVMDDVHAAPIPGAREHPFLKDVFAGGMVPVYHLEGAELIEVLDYERAEVLMDSPECAAAWGGGNLAVWFRAGHGLIMNSANHFDLQGLEVAPGLKKPEDRMAHAIDHMGLDYKSWREMRKEKWWKSSGDAAKHVHDLSAFRFLTNFVRIKRTEDE